MSRQAVATWNREPLFHVSTLREGPGAKNPRTHHDFISIADFPESWSVLDVTVEVDAKSKEVAVARLRRAFVSGGVALLAAVTT
jgi:UV DNA damage endonuclease